MTDSWVINPAPKKKRSRRSKVVGAVIGFTVAASLTAVAAWVLIPDGPGTVFGKGGQSTNGLALISLTTTGTEGLTPNNDATFKARVKNNNTFSVTLSNIVQTGPATLAGGGTCPITLGDVTLLAFTNQTPITAGGEVTVNIIARGGANLPECIQGQDVAVPVTLSGTVA